LQIYFFLLGVEQNTHIEKQILSITQLKKLPLLPAKNGEFTIFYKAEDASPVILLRVNEIQGFKNINYIRKILSAFREDLHLYFPNINDFSTIVSHHVLLGAALYGYNFSSLKTTNHLQKKVFFDDSISKDTVLNIRNEAAALITTMEIIDMPSNLKNPDFMADYIKKLGLKYNLDTKIMDRDELQKRGFGALISVGNASDFGSYLAIITYKGTPFDNVDYALIGKGVTFDTGGLSVKPSTNMHYMKSDLGGAAAVIGAMQLISDQKPECNVTALIPLVENVISAKATRPGDVITSYSGKTIEVIDTDAEGRLILSDAITYAVRDLKAKSMIDLATLTGSSVMTFGSQYAAMFTKNKDVANRLQSIGEVTGDKVWLLPMDEEYGELMQSDIADIKNFHGRPYAGAITAAKFLEFFTEGHDDWVHLDIAGMAFTDSDLVKSKVASGYGVRLLAQYVNPNNKLVL
jgi:leucyl aminopeptidase